MFSLGSTDPPLVPDQGPTTSISLPFHPPSQRSTSLFPFPFARAVQDDSDIASSASGAILEEADIVSSVSSAREDEEEPHQELSKAFGK